MSEKEIVDTPWSVPYCPLTERTVIEQATMIQTDTVQFLIPTKEFRRLSILLAIQGNPEISQHKIARLVRLSSSMVNVYIKQFQRENLITVTGSTNRTQKYHLTPSGQSKLMDFLLSYSAEIIRLYSAAKQEIAKKLKTIDGSTTHNLALFGAAETGEVVYAAIKNTPFQVTTVVDSDPSKQGSSFNGITVRHPDFLRDSGVDAVVITSFGKQEEIYAYLQKVLGNSLRVIKLSEL
jgi:DNA-binding MarR family transcriptional regulator